MVSHMETPTRLQRWLSEKLTERGHPPLSDLVTQLRSEGLSWRQVSAQITYMTEGETVSDVALLGWFGDDGERAA